MAQTNVGVNSPQAVKRFRGALFGASVPTSFWGKNMMANANSEGKTGQGANAPLCVINDLTSQAGDLVAYDLYAQLTGRATFGDDNLEGNLEKLDSYSDEIRINQVRKGVDAGGLMSRKRTINDQRVIAKDKLAEYNRSYFDQACFTTIAGARGVSTDLHIPIGATSAIDGTKTYDAYDAGHIVYPNAVAAKNALTTADTMSLTTIDRVITKVTSTGGGADGVLRMTPLDRGAGEDGYVMVMHPYQEHALRKDVGTAGWLDIQKAAAAAVGFDSPIFKNTLGTHRNVVLRSHQYVASFNDYGVGANVNAARATLMGRQAMVVAFGSPASAGMRADWTEKMLDVDNNRLAISSNMCYGLKRGKFNGNDVNCVAVDTAIVAP
jgi:N4-gp56 family major capsid protein